MANKIWKRLEERANQVDIRDVILAYEKFDINLQRLKRLKDQTVSVVVFQTVTSIFSLLGVSKQTNIISSTLYLIVSLAKASYFYNTSLSITNSLVKNDIYVDINKIITIEKKELVEHLKKIESATFNVNTPEMLILIIRLCAVIARYYEKSYDLFITELVVITINLILNKNQKKFDIKTRDALSENQTILFKSLFPFLKTAPILKLKDGFLATEISIKQDLIEIDDENLLETNKFIKLASKAIEATTKCSTIKLNKTLFLINLVITDKDVSLIKEKFNKILIEEKSKIEKKKINNKIHQLLNEITTSPVFWYLEKDNDSNFFCKSNTLFSFSNEQKEAIFLVLKNYIGEEYISLSKERFFIKNYPINEEFYEKLIHNEKETKDFFIKLKNQMNSKSNPDQENNGNSSLPKNDTSNSIYQDMQRKIGKIFSYGLSFFQSQHHLSQNNQKKEPILTGIDIKNKIEQSEDSFKFPCYSPSSQIIGWFNILKKEYNKLSAEDHRGILPQLIADYLNEKGQGKQIILLSHKSKFSNLHHKSRYKMRLNFGSYKRGETEYMGNDEQNLPCYKFSFKKHDR